MKMEDWKCNVRENVEFAMFGKQEQFEKFLERTSHFTSDNHWSGTFEKHEKGFYIQMEGCQSSFSCFISGWGAEVMRKPRNSKAIAKCSIEGFGYDVYSIRGKEFDVYG